MRLRKLFNYSLIFIMTLVFNMNVFALSGKVTDTYRTGPATHKEVTHPDLRRLD